MAETPGYVVPNCIRKHGEIASKQHPSMASASVPALSSFCPFSHGALPWQQKPNYDSVWVSMTKGAGGGQSS